MGLKDVGVREGKPEVSWWLSGKGRKNSLWRTHTNQLWPPPSSYAGLQTTLILLHWHPRPSGLELTPSGHLYDLRTDITASHNGFWRLFKVLWVPRNSYLPCFASFTSFTSVSFFIVRVPSWPHFLRLSRFHRASSVVFGDPEWYSNCKMFLCS